MKVAQISKTDARGGGGASRVAAELGVLLQERGVTVDHFAGRVTGDESSKVTPFFGRFTAIMLRILERCKKWGYPDFIPFELPFLLIGCRIRAYDLLHFHDLSSVISPFTLQYLSKKQPVVWTFHDCSAFTGGCLYPMECVRYKHSCGHCPGLGEWPINTDVDRTRTLLWARKCLAATGRVMAVAPSEWMANKAYGSGMMARRPLVISNGVDIEVFRPQDKNRLRKELGLPVDRFIVLVSASNLLEGRKGTEYALAALREIQAEQPFILVVGWCGDICRKKLEGFDYSATDFVVKQEALAAFYAAADLILFCSLADNQPLSILETMASGTPTIGFKTGGIPEIISQGETGCLVEQGDVKALVLLLKEVLKNPEKLSTWGKAARKQAVACYSHNQFLENHVELYQNTIASKVVPEESR